MTKTTNYQLPQWEAHDPVRREDFNGAFAALDGAYSPEKKPWELGNCQISSDLVGTVIKSFDFTPSLVLVWAASYYIGVTDGNITATVRGSASNGGLCYFELIGNQLKLSYFYNGPTKIYYLALK